MKTQRTISANFKKVGLSFLLGTFLITGGIAQTSYSKNNAKNLLSSKSVETVDDAFSVIAKVEVDVYANSLDFVLEKPVELENWMTGDTDWAENNGLTEYTNENGPELENWMTNLNDFHQAHTEDTLKLEAWMKTSDWDF